MVRYKHSAKLAFLLVLLLAEEVVKEEEEVGVEVVLEEGVGCGVMGAGPRWISGWGRCCCCCCC